MQHPAWNLIVLGGLILLIGLVWLIAPSILWLGQLPGDIAIERDNFSFHFPVIDVHPAESGIVIRYFSR